MSSSLETFNDQATITDLTPLPQSAEQQHQQALPSEPSTLSQESSEAPAAPTLSKHEEQAIATGRWQPKDQWKGDPDEWRPAKEWLDRGELLDTIHQLNRQSREQKEVLEHLTAHNKRIEELTYKRAIQESEEKQRRAVEIGDVHATREATQELIDLHQQKATAVPITPAQPSFDPAYTGFIAQNSHWFNDSTAEHSAMKAYALRRNQEIEQANPHMSPAESMRLLHEDVKRQFPAKFGRPAPVNLHAVAPPASVQAKPSQISVSSLDVGHQRIIQKLKRQIPGYDERQYIKELKDLGEI